MAKDKEEKKEDKKDEPVDERTALWAEFVANYKAKNPVKWAQKDARGELVTPPASFLGKKVVRTLPNGTVRVEIL